MFITSRWSSLQKRHPHACPKEMWHFAFCTVTPQLGDVKTCQNQPQSFSHRKPPAQESLEMFECQRSRRSSLEQEPENLRKRKTKEQRRSKETEQYRTPSEHIQNTTESSDIHQIFIRYLRTLQLCGGSMVGAHGNAIRPWAWSCFQWSHSHGSFRMPTRRPKGAMGLRATSSMKALWKLWKILKVFERIKRKCRFQMISNDFNLFPRTSQNA